MRGGGICESAVKIDDNAREWVHILQEYVNILMGFPNDSERSWIVGHHFDSTVWFMDIYCAHRGVTPLAARPPLERD